MKFFKLPVVVFALSFFLFHFASGAFAASLSLSPASTTKNVGDSFTVDIVLDTEGEAVSGATAIINYDKTKLAVVDGAAGSGDCKDGVNIFSGPNLSQCIENTVSASTGQIVYTSANLGAAYTGRGIIGTITFSANSTGLASVSFVFNPNVTTNTSAVAAASGPTNLLETITDGSYTINAGGTTTDEDTLVESGIVEDTLMLLFGGFAFLGSGIFLARKAIFNAR